MSDAIKLSIINQALTRTGNTRIGQLGEGTTEDIVALTNYDALVEDELSGHPWFFASKSAELSLLAAESTKPLQYRWQLPSDHISVRRVDWSGSSVPIDDYDIEDDFLRLSFNTGTVTLLYTWRAGEGKWPPNFQQAIVKRMMAVFRSGLNEEVSEAENEDRAADRKVKFARSARSRQDASREVSKGGPLVERRRNG